MKLSSLCLLVAIVGFGGCVNDSRNYNELNIEEATSLGMFYASAAERKSCSLLATADEFSQSYSALGAVIRRTADRNPIMVGFRDSCKGKIKP
jgi:hypothetical protein